VKDKSRYTRSWDPDGSAQDLWDEDYAVINFHGEEVFRAPSRIEAERWIRAETARFFSGALNLLDSRSRRATGVAALVASWEHFP
jgi:hypothetical protein